MDYATVAKKVPVGLAGIKLYCLVTEAHMCVQVCQLLR